MREKRKAKFYVSLSALNGLLHLPSEMEVVGVETPYEDTVLQKRIVVYVANRSGLGVGDILDEVPDGGDVPVIESPVGKTTKEFERVYAVEKREGDA